MKLLPIGHAEIPLVAGWLGQKENYQWLDLGNGRQIIDALMLKIMIQRADNHVRLFTTDHADLPIGLVSFSNIALSFKTANLWYVLGDRAHGQKGYTTKAVSRLLHYGFTTLGLESVFAWAVEQNRPSVRVLEYNHFRFVGRLRHSHRLDDQPVDRLLFDLMTSEYRPISDPLEPRGAEITTDSFDGLMRPAD